MITEHAIGINKCKPTGAPFRGHNKACYISQIPNCMVTVFFSSRTALPVNILLKKKHYEVIAIIPIRTDIHPVLFWPTYLFPISVYFPRFSFFVTLAK